MDRDQLVEHLKFASELGVTGVSSDPKWRTRDIPAVQVTGSTDVDPAASTPSAAAAPTTDAGEPVTLIRSASEVLESIRTDIGPLCTRCKLHKLGRTEVVYGVGNREARLMFVGEAPGADEDEQGIPFVGRAGQLLTKIIEAIELSRDDVYIANVIKCRPPGNRNPEPDEIERCEPFLFRQIDTIKP